MIIFDLDGTLADCEHRRHLVSGKPRDGGKNWDAFFKACVRDTPIFPVIQTLRAIETFLPVQIWSGRSEVVRPETEEWLRQYVFNGRINWLDPFSIRHVPLRMRPAGDTRPDVALKESWLLEVLARGASIDMVFDDRQKVVDMWRRHGIVCAQVAPGAY